MDLEARRFPPLRYLEIGVCTCRELIPRRVHLETNLGSLH